MEAPDIYKKRVGRVILTLNSDVLTLQKQYKKLKEGTNLTQADQKLEESALACLKQLKSELLQLDKEADYVKHNKLENYHKMIKTTIETAQSVLEDKNTAADARKTAENLKKEIEDCLNLLDSEKSLQNLKLSVHQSANEEKVVMEWDSDIKKEFEGLDKHVKAKYLRIENDIKKKMEDQINILEKVWIDEMESLDYQGRYLQRWHIWTIFRAIRPLRL